MEMEKNSLTLTVVANMTSNYSEGLGNISSIQKVFKNKKAYAIRSRESLKNAIMVQSGMYDDLQTSVDGATQKLVTSELNASNCRALEGGYMNTSGKANKRNSSFYLTDAISCESFINETRFHNNLFLASNYAKTNKINLQDNAGEAGLMPYQYEYDKSLKVYSLTIDLEMIGKDENFNEEANKNEKEERVIAILDAVEYLHLIVKGNLDNAEPIFVVGGMSDRKTHYFENVVKVVDENLLITDDLKYKIKQGYKVGLLKGNNFKNELEIERTLDPVPISTFFNTLKTEVKEYYGE
ncbi:type I-B CRISPR-associated protein Cas7/Cst2/DevR [Ectobacillus sp. sgz5001026]|uniref:type I-B CRISPR-associated protein Cas7/Cst2/DevR n=1 Tax=Ectobacillus sp. sgz5001026 TaxID=3242473 RepID=UPI0036D31CA7